MTSHTLLRTRTLRKTLVASALLLLTLACGPKTEDDAAASGMNADSLAAAGDSANPTRAIGALPRIGIAVADTGLAWCGAMMNDAASPALESGAQVMVVFAGAASVPARAGQVVRRRGNECPAAFGQPRWSDYTAYDVALVDELPPGGAEMPTVALLVASDEAWTRDANGFVRADLDGDGRPEEARRCTAGEGEHLTVWSETPDGTTVRRWHEYFDWGALTEPTCRPGEDGVDAAADSTAV